MIKGRRPQHKSQLKRRRTGKGYGWKELLADSHSLNIKAHEETKREEEREMKDKTVIVISSNGIWVTVHIQSMFRSIIWALWGNLRETFSIKIHCRYLTFNYPNVRSKTIVESFSAAADTNNYMKSWGQVSLLNTKAEEYLPLEYIIQPPGTTFSTIPGSVIRPRYNI